MKDRGLVFWLVHTPGWLLVVYLIYAQGITAFDYQLGVRMGTQEPASQITEVGTPFWIVLPLISAWGAYALWRLSTHDTMERF
jgi:hypothetical protein